MVHSYKIQNTQIPRPSTPPPPFFSTQPLWNAENFSNNRGTIRLSRRTPFQGVGLLVRWFVTLPQAVETCSRMNYFIKLCFIVICLFLILCMFLKVHDYH